MTIRIMSTRLDYHTKSNNTTHILTIMKIKGATIMDTSNEIKPDNDLTVNEVRAEALMEMTGKLAGKWDDVYATAPKD